MKEQDTYNKIAKYYDYMLNKDDEREKFFNNIFHSKFYGNWNLEKYSIDKSNRLIIVVRK